MCVVGAAVVVVVEPVHGARFAVCWDGGETAAVHTIEDGRYGPVFERWQMVDPVTGCPHIQCTPAALAELARFRLEETPGAAELVAAAGGVAAMC